MSIYIIIYIYTLYIHIITDACVQTHDSYMLLSEDAMALRPVDSGPGGPGAAGARAQRRGGHSENRGGTAAKMVFSQDLPWKITILKYV